MDYSEILISKGMEAMLHNIVVGGLFPSTEIEETLWNTVVELLKSNPQELVDFAIGILKRSKLTNRNKVRSEAENWQRYVR